MDQQHDQNHNVTRGTIKDKNGVIYQLVVLIRGNEFPINSHRISQYLHYQIIVRETFTSSHN